jgi:rfaE bifunctional protein kinase chain/domain
MKAGLGNKLGNHTLISGQNLPDFKKARILVVGDVMLDRYWFGDVSRISPEAPVPVVKIGRTEERPGGAANVARNIATLGARASLLSVIGNDEPGNTLVGLLKDAGVDIHLHRDSTISTTVKLRVVGRQQQLLRVDFETTPSREVLSGKLAEFSNLLRKCDAVILSDYGKGGLIHIVKMIELARKHRKPVLVDPKGDDYKRYAGATIATPNRAELQEVVGPWRNDKELRLKAQRLRQKLQMDALLVTRSEEGMTLFRDIGMHHEPARAREVYDVSGAGDTVIAALAAMLASGASMEEAVHVANIAAGIVVGKLGTATVGFDELRMALIADVAKGVH